MRDTKQSGKCDYYLWKILKDRVYVNSSDSLQELK
jgi:hypothetical protein